VTRGEVLAFEASVSSLAREDRRPESSVTPCGPLARRAGYGSSPVRSRVVRSRQGDDSSVPRTISLMWNDRGVSVPSTVATAPGPRPRSRPRRRRSVSRARDLRRRRRGCADPPRTSEIPPPCGISAIAADTDILLCHSRSERLKEFRSRRPHRPSPAERR